jgi:hypothetical protein
MSDKPNDQHDHHGESEAECPSVSRPDHDKRRRRFLKGATAAAPVIMTIASRPAFGVVTGMECFSSTLSGNLSHPEKFECAAGFSPGAWKNKPCLWDGTASGWSDTGYDYGTCTNPKTPGGPCTKCDEYTGGSTVADAFGGSDSRPMRQVLCEDNGSLLWHLIAALLNSLAIPEYVFRTDQVIDIYHGVLLADKTEEQIKNILSATWQNEPNQPDCNKNFG